MFDYNTSGIPDDQFIRESFPMTKEEVRAVCLAKLRLSEGMKVVDIGAGTGSVTVEMARLLKNGSVTAVEREAEACELIKKNCEKFRLLNVDVINCEAPKFNKGITGFDRIFIGGSGTELNSILQWSLGVLKKGGRIVLTAITLETLNAASDFLNNNFKEVDIAQITVSKIKKVGSKHMFKTENSVFILSGEKGE